MCVCVSVRARARICLGFSLCQDCFCIVGCDWVCHDTYVCLWLVRISLSGCINVCMFVCVCACVRVSFVQVCQWVFRGVCISMPC